MKTRPVLFLSQGKTLSASSANWTVYKTKSPAQWHSDVTYFQAMQLTRPGLVNTKLNM